MAPGTLRFGVVGYGQAAASILKAILGSGRFSVVGVADPDPAARAAFEAATGMPGYDSLEQLCATSGPDVLYVASPTRLREEHALAGLAAGCHLLVEKPIAPTLEAAQRMLAAAATASRALVVCHKRSVDAPILAMRQTIAAGDVGRVRLVHRWHMSDWLYRPRLADEFTPPFGGSVVRQGAHEFDIIRFLVANTASAVRGWTGDFDPDRPGEGAYQAWVDFAGGALGMSYFSGYDHFLDEELAGEEVEPNSIGAMRRMLGAQLAGGRDQAELKRQFQVTTGGANRGYTFVSCEGADLRSAPDGGAFVYGNDGRRLVHASGPTGGRFIAEELYLAAVEGRPPVHDGAWGLSNLEICLATRQSAQCGGMVELRHQGVADMALVEELQTRA